MRVSRNQAAENRETVITVASRLFRQHGFDGIGLKDLMKGAGLTQGAFYKQFSSKEDLAKQASKRAWESAFNRWSAAIAGKPEDPIGAVMAFYLSMGHREGKMDGCPLAALGSDAARQSAEVRTSFETGVRAHIDILDSLIHQNGGSEHKSEAMAVLSLMVGALTVSRVVNDPDFAQAILDASSEQIRNIATASKRRR